MLINAELVVKIVQPLLVQVSNKMHSVVKSEGWLVGWEGGSAPPALACPHPLWWSLSPTWPKISFSTLMQNCFSWLSTGKFLQLQNASKNQLLSWFYPVPAVGACCTLQLVGPPGTPLPTLSPLGFEKPPPPVMHTSLTAECIHVLK